MQKIIAQNRKAGHTYQLGDSFEAGVELRGGEVKSIRAGEVSIAESFIQIRGGQAYLVNAYIKPYEAAGTPPEEANRTRKLLLHQEEIAKLAGDAQAKSQTIVATKMYLKKGLVKVEIALGKGKKLHDKRQTLKKRDQEREAEQAVRDQAKR